MAKCWIVFLKREKANFFPRNHVDQQFDYIHGIAVIYYLQGKKKIQDAILQYFSLINSTNPNIY